MCIDSHLFPLPLTTGGANGLIFAVLIGLRALAAGLTGSSGGEDGRSLMGRLCDSVTNV